MEGGRTARQRWMTLGAHGQITPDQARALAQQVLAAVARGEDPQATRFQQRSAPTIADLWARFEAEYFPERKLSTRTEYASQWRELIGPKFGKLKAEAITSNDIDRFHKSLRQVPYRANRVLALLSRLMSLAERWGIRPPGSNPCRSITRFPERARTRFLDLDELRRVGEAIDCLVASQAVHPTAAYAIELLLLTGARRDEILAAEWQWVDWKRAVLNLPDSKTGAKQVYFSDAALEVLLRQREVSGDGRFIFPSQRGTGRFVNLRKSWVRVCRHADLEGVRLHDLRHTAASIAVGQGASLAIVGKLLGHTQAQTTLRYAHVDIDPALKAANEIGRAVGDAMRRQRDSAKSPEL